MLVTYVSIKRTRIDQGASDEKLSTNISILGGKSSREVMVKVGGLFSHT